MQTITPSEIRLNRAQFNLTQRELAELLGIHSNSVISEWENGKTCPNRVNTAKLRDLFGLDKISQNEPAKLPPPSKIVKAVAPVEQTAKKNESSVQSTLAALVVMQGEFVRLGDWDKYHKMQRAVNDIIECLTS